LISKLQVTESKNNCNLPLISVITVVFNSENFIERTIRSVLEQNYPNTEYIVIDGGSSDRTLEIVNRFKSKIKYFISEPDAGIYDAMNKGLAAAKGDWVNFMNAGDIFYSENTLSKVFIKLECPAQILYGGVEIDYHKFSRRENPGSPNKLWQGMQFSHQSIFVDLKYHKNNLFNINNNITADLEFLYNAYTNGIIFKKINQIISRVVIGGISEANRYQTIKSSCNAICGRRVKPLVRIYFLTLFVDLFIRKALKLVLPKKLVKKIILSKEK